MRNFVFPLLLCSAFILPSAARADAIDDFVITGNGLDITFSLPASPPGNESTCPSGIITSCLPGSETAFYLSALVTDNGVTTLQALAFPTIFFGGGLEIGATRYYSNYVLFTPNAATPTFTPGTYSVNTLGSFGSDTLTITPETTATTPEPSTLGLLGTGVIGLIGLVRRKRGWS
jgi:hypothetical protein